MLFSIEQILTRFEDKLYINRGFEHQQTLVLNKNYDIVSHVTSMEAGVSLVIINMLWL